MKYILAIDIGTTAIKVILFQTDGQILAKSSQEYQLLSPSELAVELEVETYWKVFKQGVAEILAKSKIAPNQIHSLGISAQGETLILLDKDGSPLTNAIVWLDNRAQKESKELAHVFGKEETYKRTGQIEIIPIWPASKILWFKKNRPEIFYKVGKFLLIEDYFIYRLTGRYLCEGSLICSTVYWDITEKVWWKEMLNYLGIKEEQLPEIYESGKVAGPLLPNIAKELGLSIRTIVAVGALDQACGAIGVGNIVPGVISENTGAALSICATIERPIKKRYIPSFYHGIPNTYMAHIFSTGGMVLRWYKDNFCSSEINLASLIQADLYKILDQEAEKVPPGCNGLVMLPHLQGVMAPPKPNPRAKGVFYGFTLHHGKPHFIRSIMEAVAFELKRTIDLLEDLGIKVIEIRSLGGGSKSPLWSQIKADVTQRTIYTMQNEEAACLGA